MKARVVVVALSALCLMAWAASGAVVAPKQAASLKPQAPSIKYQTTALGTEAITIPSMLSYQGKLTDTLGQPVPNGNYQLTFRLYTVPTGGSALWSEAQTVPVSGGLFAVLLGSVTPITSLPDSGALYVGLQVQTSPELTPRLQIASAAYSYLAGRAAITDRLRLPCSESVATDDAGLRIVDTLTNNGGITIEAQNSVTDGNGIAVWGIGGSLGVMGSVSPTGSSSYTGAYGTAQGGSGTNYGVYGSGWGSGTNYGVYGQANGGSTNYGVYGYTPGPGGTNYAGYFQGNVHITGSLSKGGGSFQIDHPLDPLNKYLYHSFVESPDMKNIYDGTVKTDASGYATVTLPNWFEALNRDFRYQLTVIDEGDGNGFSQAKVVRGVKDNSFVIRTSVPSTTVSWQVTGIRQDPYANKHRIQVEVDKPASERGKYLYPDAYGVPREQGIGYHAPPAVPNAKPSQSVGMKHNNLPGVPPGTVSPSSSSITTTAPAPKPNTPQDKGTDR